MAEIDALMGLGVSDEEKARILANRLRGQAEAADLFALSTIDPVARGARAQQEAARDAASQGGVLRKSLAEAQGASGPNIGKYNPGDYTPESFAAFKEGGYQDPKVLVRHDPFTVGGVRVQDGEPVVSPDQIAGWKAQQAGAETTAEAFARSREEWRKNESKLLSGIDSARSKNKLIEDTIDKALERLSGWTTSYGGLIADLPGTESKQLSNLLDTIKANVGFEYLGEMRQNSPSGGALGNVSNIELELLQSTMGSLDQLGDMNDIADVLRTIKAQNQGRVDRLQRAYDMDRARYRGEKQEDKQESTGKTRMRWNPETGTLEEVE